MENRKELSHYGRRWSFDDEDFVVKNYLKMKPADMAQRLGRSLDGVINVIRRNSLSRMKNEMVSTAWGSRDRMILTPAEYLAAFGDIDDDTRTLLLLKRRNEVADCMMALCLHGKKESHDYGEAFRKMHRNYAELSAAIGMNSARIAA